ncbi:hypothetical protein BDZ88DRAFT_315089 [Geranomyces variabilis]|nr:hypothetical protein BDZ88DRAFT_315089 [Geranomyces variabilis]
MAKQQQLTDTLSRLAATALSYTLSVGLLCATIALACPNSFQNGVAVEVEEESEEEEQEVQLPTAQYHHHRIYDNGEKRTHPITVRKTWRGRWRHRLCKSTSPLVRKDLPLFFLRK